MGHGKQGDSICFATFNWAEVPDSRDCLALRPHGNDATHLLRRDLVRASSCYLACQNLTPAKLGLIAPQAMQNHRELAGDSDAPLLSPAAWVSRKASAVSGATPGTDINCRQMGSTRTASRTRRVSRSSWQCMAAMMASKGSVISASEGAASASSHARVANSLGPGAPTLSALPRSTTRAAFSMSRTLQSTVRRATSNERDIRDGALLM